MMNQFKRRRLLASMSIREAAKRIGVAESAIGHWEGGRTFPRAGRLARIAAVYGCSVADLIDDNDKKENAK